MMLTTKGRYAVAAILELAALPANIPVKLSEVAFAQNITVSYLEQIFAKLRKAGLVKAIKGPGGGYILNIQPKDIKIVAIIDAVEENIEMSSCRLMKKNICLAANKNMKCKTHSLWQGLTNQIRGYFENVTLQDVLQNRIG